MATTLIMRDNGVIRVLVNGKPTSLKLYAAKPMDVRHFINQDGSYTDAQLDAKVEELVSRGETHF